MSFTDEKIAVVVGILAAVLYLAVLAIAVANYVMVSLSVYTMAKRQGIRGAGLAWVPVANVWVIGELVNGIDAKRGLARKWNVTLLTLTLVSVGGGLVAYVALAIAGILYALFSAEYILLLLLPFYVLIILAMVASVALTACLVICIYKIFEDARPEKAVRYLLFYMLVPLGAGVCMMKVRDSLIPPVDELPEE